MKKTVCLVLLLFCSAGCATYKLKQAPAPYNKGYVFARDNLMIAEYTIGRDAAFPAREDARARFQRRRRSVEHFYKKMGLIENRFKQAVVDPAVFFFKIIGGILRLPAYGISDYRYENDPKYRQRQKDLEAQRDAREAAYVLGWRTLLNDYLEKDLSREEASSPKGGSRR